MEVLYALLPILINVIFVAAIIGILFYAAKRFFAAPRFIHHFPVSGGSYLLDAEEKELINTEYIMRIYRAGTCVLAELFGGRHYKLKECPDEDAAKVYFNQISAEIIKKKGE